MKLYSRALASLFFCVFIVKTGMADCLPQINWGGSISFCEGNSFTLSAFNQSSTYLWSTGATSPSLTINASGKYWVTVTNACGSASDTIDVIVDEPLNVDLGVNRSFCSGNPVLLALPFHAYTSYQWSTGATGNQISVNQSGTYFVTATNACGTYSDTVTLTAQHPTSFSLGADIVNCTKSPSVLSIPNGLEGTVIWNDGSTGSSITVNSSGNYWASVTNACGVFSDTVMVSFLLPGNFFPTSTFSLCTGETITIHSPSGATGHLWSNGSVAPSIQVSQPGSYWLRLTSSCGFVYDTVHVVQKNRATVNLGSDTTLCSSGGFALDAGNSGSIYQWSTGTSSQQLSVTKSGNYWVGVDNGCGFTYDTINVVLQPVPNPAINDSIYVCENSTSPNIDAGLWGANTSYLWSDGFTGRVHTGLSAGSYWVKVKNTCDTIQRNFHIVSQSAPHINLGNDTTLCQNSLILSVPVAPEGNSFYWSTGCTGNSCKVSKTDFYWVQVTNACGTFTDTIHVTLNKLPRKITEDTIYKCTGSSTVLKTKNIANTTYLWSNGATAFSTTVTAPGTYWHYAYNVCDTIRDTVEVVDVDPLVVALGGDTTFCRPNNLLLDLSSVPADSIVWSTGVNASSITVTKSGTYWVQAFNYCGVFSDTINVIVNRGPEAILRDTSFCQNGSVLLNSYQARVDSYQWNTGDTTSGIVVSQPGWYYVDMFNECNSLRDSVFVARDVNLPAINLGSDTIFCAGSLLLDPGKFGGAKYLWQNGDTSATFTVTKSGTYYVNIHNACNSVSDTVHVLVTGPPAVALGNSVKFCRGSILNLNAQNPGCTYLWNTGATTQTLSVSTAGLYWVTISNACGTLTDSVNVIVEDPLHNLSLGNDTIICRGDSILLETKIPGVYTKWQNGSNTNAIYVKETGDYWVEVSNSCGTWEDTIHVEVQDVPYFSFGGDTVLCADGGSVFLEGPSGMDSYTWSNGVTTRQQLITEEGSYWLTVANKCFSYTDTIVLREEYPLDIDLGPDTVLCHGESLFLSANFNGHSAKWSDNTHAETQEVTRSGTYWVMTQNSCGIFSDTINVRFDDHLNPEPEKITICRDDTTTVDLSELEYDFRWWDGSVEKTRKFYQEGTYPLFITNKCGEFQKDYVVDVTNCDCPFFVANAFTPNGDGLNEEFTIGHSCDLTDFNLQIFNRWGQKVFESTDAEHSWDGRYGGADQPGGVYTYSIQYQWDVYGATHLRTKTGILNLIR